MLLRTLERVVGMELDTANKVFEIVEDVAKQWNRAEWLAAFSARYGGYSLDGLDENQQNALLRGGIIMAQGFIIRIDTRAADAIESLRCLPTQEHTATHVYLRTGGGERVSIAIAEPLPTALFPFIYHRLGTAMVSMYYEGLSPCFDTLAGVPDVIHDRNTALPAVLEIYRTLFANTVARKAFPDPVRLERLPTAAGTPCQIVADLPSVRRELNSFIRIAREITTRAT